MPPESRTVTLELPYSLFQQAQRTAEHTHRSVEDILVESVASALPKVKDLPQELADDVSDLAFLNDAGLWKIVRSGLPAEHHRQMDDLLDRKQRGEGDDRHRPRVPLSHRRAPRGGRHGRGTPSAEAAARC